MEEVSDETNSFEHCTAGKRWMKAPATRWWWSIGRTRPGKGYDRSMKALSIGAGRNLGARARADSDKYKYHPAVLMADIFDTETKRAVFRGVMPKGLSGSSERTR